MFHCIQFHYSFSAELVSNSSDAVACLHFNLGLNYFKTIFSALYGRNLPQTIAGILDQLIQFAPRVSHATGRGRHDLEVRMVYCSPSEGLPQHWAGKGQVGHSNFYVEAGSTEFDLDGFLHFPMNLSKFLSSQPSFLVSPNYYTPSDLSFPRVGLGGHLLH